LSYHITRWDALRFIGAAFVSTRATALASAVTVKSGPPIFVPMRHLTLPQPAGLEIPGATLFDEPDLHGRSLSITGYACPYVGEVMFHKCRSILVDAGVWRFYRHQNYNGNSSSGAGVEWFDIGPGHYARIQDISFEGKRLGSRWIDAIAAGEPIQYR
jgi:hypothetical protein